MDLDSTSDSSDSSSPKYWVDQFLMKKGNHYFCNVDEDFILDRFNLTGIASEVLWYSTAMEVITDKLDVENFANPQTREALTASACHLYGLIHARFIITTKGLQKMAEKLREAHFGSCPRALCQGSPVLPIGLHDEPGISTVKLYCSICQDVYTPPKSSSRRNILDGAYWGTSFPHLLVQSHPNLISRTVPLEMYVPKIFGFRIHEQSNLQRQKLKLKEKIARQAKSGLLNSHSISDTEKNSKPNDDEESDEEVEEIMIHNQEACTLHSNSVKAIDGKRNFDQFLSGNDDVKAGVMTEEKMEEGSQEV